MANINSLEDIAKACGGLWAAVSQSLLASDEAVSLSAMLGDHASVLEASDIEARLRALEEAEERRMA
jgi:hypothetical protein